MWVGMSLDHQRRYQDILLLLFVYEVLLFDCYIGVASLVVVFLI